MLYIIVLISVIKKCEISYMYTYISAMAPHSSTFA